jgi:aurora kinase, other
MSTTRLLRKRKLDDLVAQEEDNDDEDDEEENDNNENNCNEWTINDFSIGKPLGRGRFGRVYLAKENRTKHQILCALKILFKSMLMKNKAQVNFKLECELQIKLRHPNVLRLFNWFHDDKKIYLILEYAVNGSLYKKLEKIGYFDNRQTATVN